MSPVEQELFFTSGAPEYTTCFNGVCVVYSLVIYYYVVFYGPLFVFLPPPFFWPVYCLLLFASRLLTSPLISCTALLVMTFVDCTTVKLCLFDLHWAFFLSSSNMKHLPLHHFEEKYYPFFFLSFFQRYYRDIVPVSLVIKKKLRWKLIYTFRIWV